MGDTSPSAGISRSAGKNSSTHAVARQKPGSHVDKSKSDVTKLKTRHSLGSTENDSLMNRFKTCSVPARLKQMRTDHSPAPVVKVVNRSFDSAQYSKAEDRLFGGFYTMGVQQKSSARNGTLHDYEVKLLCASKLIQQRFDALYNDMVGSAAAPKKSKLGKEVGSSDKLGQFNADSIKSNPGKSSVVPAGAVPSSSGVSSVSHNQNELQCRYAQLLPASDPVASRSALIKPTSSASNVTFNKNENGPPAVRSSHHDGSHCSTSSSDSTAEIITTSTEVGSRQKPNEFSSPSSPDNIINKNNKSHPACSESAKSSLNKKLSQRNGALHDFEVKLLCASEMIQKKFDAIYDDLVKPSASAEKPITNVQPSNGMLDISKSKTDKVPVLRVSSEIELSSSPSIMPSLSTTPASSTVKACKSVSKSNLQTSAKLDHTISSTSCATSIPTECQKPAIISSPTHHAGKDGKTSNPGCDGDDIIVINDDGGDDSDTASNHSGIVVRKKLTASKKRKSSSGLANQCRKKRKSSDSSKKTHEESHVNRPHKPARNSKQISSRKTQKKSPASISRSSKSTKKETASAEKAKSRSRKSPGNVSKVKTKSKTSKPAQKKVHRDRNSENLVGCKTKNMEQTGLLPNFVSNVHDQFMELEAVATMPLSDLHYANGTMRHGITESNNGSDLGSLFGKKGRHRGHVGGIWTNIVGTVVDEG